MKGRQDLKRRTFEFALSAVRTAGEFRQSEAGAIIRKQFIRAATSVGANYRASQTARSKAEFVAKLQVALEEADESAYWLELASEADLLGHMSMDYLHAEANELAAIFMSSLKTAKGIQ